MSRKILMDEALKNLSRQAYTEQKLTAQLKKAGFPEKEIADCLIRLKKWNYVNDREFGITRIKQLQSRLKSRSYISLDLENHGLPGQLVAELLNSYYPEEKEWEIASKLLGKKATSGQAQSKIWVYLVRNGFSENTIHHCFPSIDPT